MGSYLFKRRIPQHDRIAFIASPRLGDALISLIIVNNLARNGYAVTYFSDVLAPLFAWFPEIDIQPLPEIGQAKTIFTDYDVLLHKYRHNMIADVEDWHPCVRTLADSPLYRSRQSMVDIQVALCREELFCEDVTRDNGLQAPGHLQSGKYPRRVLLHPGSSQAFRQWRPARFLRLAKWLLAKHYEPHMVIQADDRALWEPAVQQGIGLICEPLPVLAAQLFESGFFIGNDSGVGHLASNVGTPTLTLCLRKSLARQWAPHWAPREVILPPCWLVSRPLKERFWSQAVTVGRVRRGFERLTQLIIA